MLILAVVLTLGLTWLVCSVSQGMQSACDFDLHRRWVVCQFVRRGINPYPLALTALRRTYGTLGDGGPKPRIYDVPRLAADDPAVDPTVRPALAAFGTPEPVYPPSADLPLSLIPGLLPEGRVHLAGMLGNLVLLMVCTALLCPPSTGGSAFSARAMVTTLAVALAWSPTQAAVRAGQFSIFVTVCLLLAFRSLRRHEYRAGIWLGLALIKPSLSLPFLIYPSIRGHWRALIVALVLHLAATGVQALRFGVAPGELLFQWTSVAAYFAQGQFTLQEVVSALRLADAPVGWAIVAAFLSFALLWCLINRDAEDALLIEFLSFVCILWTYHGPYDFVILLIPLARRLVPSIAPEALGDPAAATSIRRIASVLPALTLFACVSLAASPQVYGDEVHGVAHLVRHAARSLLALGFLVSTIDVRRSARTAKRAARSPSFPEWSDPRELAELAGGSRLR